MPFDFDKPTDRRSTFSYKWDVGEGELPMWVADMDFETAPAIRRAIERRAAQGIFGYTTVPSAWGEAIAACFRRRHAMEMDPEHLIFATGVVPAISSIVRKLTNVAEKVILQTPVYNIFFNSIYNNGRYVLESPLSYDGNDYKIDFEDLESKLADPQATLLILCNPHNPIGKIWDRETLARIGELCARHHVTVLSDEIHGELTDPSRSYVPFCAASPICARVGIAVFAPTKTYNLAGLQTAAVYVPDPILRHKVWRGLNTDEVAEPNAFAIDAAIAAYNEGDAWLDELRVYLKQNRETVRDYLARELPMVRPLPADATYLIWLDCSALTDDSVALAAFIRRTTGLYLSDGAAFGAPGRCFLRMNVATQRERVLDGLDRLAHAVRIWLSEEGSNGGG